MSNEETISLMDAISDSDALLPVTDSKHATDGTVIAWSHIHVQCRQQPTRRSRFRQLASKAPRILLDDLSGIARPGQVVAIMGASGAGKTTLVKVLSGQDDPRTTITNGDVLLDGRMTTRPQRLNGSIIGLVEQNELFVETMSLEEHLIFQAMLRMPRSMLDDERRTHIRSIMTLLSLDQSGNVLIYQLSGGERKRLAFATVLLTNPSVVLIDEPTSGLDSYLAKLLMQIIRRMGVELHRTIIVVLHQPTSDMFSLVDALCLLVHGGRQAFFGAVDEAPMFFSSQCGLSAPSLDIYIEQLAAPFRSNDQSLHQGTKVADCFAQSIHARELIEIIATRTHGKSSDKLESETVFSYGKTHYESGFFRQAKWLLWRTWIADLRDPKKKMSMLLSTLFMSLVIGVIFFRLNPMINDYKQDVNSLSLVMFYAIIDSNMGLLLVSIPAERPRIIRDWKRRTYSLLAYYLARWITDTFFIVFSSILYLSIVIFLVGMRRPLLVMTIGTLQVMTACGLASFVASLSSSPRIGLLILQPMQISLGQFSGFYMNSHSIPHYINWMRYVSYMHHGYKLMLISQWRNISIPCDSLTDLTGKTTVSRSGQTPCTQMGEDILNFYGADPDRFSMTMSSLITLGLSFHFAAYIINVVRLRRAV